MFESKRFMDIRTGEIVTRFNILDIRFMKQMCEFCGKDIAVGKLDDFEACESCIERAKEVSL